MSSQKTYISFSKKDRIVTAVSDYPIAVNNETVKIIETNRSFDGLIGKKIPDHFLEISDFEKKHPSELRIALICNWQTKCGISTYSKFLYDAICPMVKEIKIFSEDVPESAKTSPDGPNVDRCWTRGDSLVNMGKNVLDWNPDFIILQHEFGIFPNLFYFMQLMQLFSKTPYVVTMHSVFEHLDKIVYSDSVKNIIVHTEQAKEILLKHGNNSKIHVIPHGCPLPMNLPELWNICHNPYTIMQFGFGFQYKGVEKAIDAIHYLKTNDAKFSNIFYFYLLSENEFTKHAHDSYYNSLLQKINDLGLENNIAINRKFQTDQMLSLYLRLAKLAIFPYATSPNNTVYASSGAIRLAMAHGIPVIASDAHLFDDIAGVVPRPKDYLELAKEIDEIFSNSSYKNDMESRINNFLISNSWEITAKKYISLYENIVL